VIAVTLTRFEMLIAASIGVRRHIGVAANGQHRSPLGDGDAWGNDIEGACGEVAFAKVANVYYDGSVNTFTKGGDVGKVQIRTRRKPTYELIIRPHDRDDDVFVLVRGVAPRYQVVGWLVAREAKRAEWLHDYGDGAPAYFVPDGALRPIEDLIAAGREPSSVEVLTARDIPF